MEPFLYSIAIFCEFSICKITQVFATTVFIFFWFLLFETLKSNSQNIKKTYSTLLDFFGG